MNFNIFIAKKDNLVFKIEEDYPEVGAYLFVFKNDIVIFDSLQENYESCMELAEELYGITKEEWKLLVK